MSDNFFEDNFDLRQILDDEGFDYKENGTHFVLCECPICYKKDKLFIDKKSKLWICYACVKTNEVDENKEGRGNLWTLFLTLGFDELQTKQLFKGKKWQRYTDDFDFEKMRWDSYEQENEGHSKEIVPYQLPKWLLYLDRSEEQIRRFPEVYLYLWSRFVRTKDQYQRFLLYYDTYQKRIVFPAITRNFICVGSQSRDITNRCNEDHPKCPNPDCELRYHYYFKGEEEAPEFCPNCNSKLEDTFYSKSLNTRNFPKTEFFYNEQNIDWTKPVVLVEGPFDSTNVDNSMAFLGKVLSDTQFNILIEKNPPLIIIYLDGDSAGDYSSQEIYNQLRAFFEVKIVFSENKDDPGSFSLEENKKKVDSACQPDEWFTRKNLVYI